MCPPLSTSTLLLSYVLVWIMAKAKACPVCGSNKWRKDAISGNAACEEGHVFQVSSRDRMTVANE